MAQLHQGKAFVHQSIIIMLFLHDLEHLRDYSHLDDHPRCLLVLAEVVENADSCAEKLLLTARQ
jgi:hypothetical protein